MVEKIVKDYLQSSLGIPVRLEEDKLTNEYVLIEKTGSSKKDHISTATIAIQSYSVSLYGAASLNERVKEAMEKIVGRITNNNFTIFNSFQCFLRHQFLFTRAKSNNV